MAIKMGINAISCEGLYADVKESGFGKGNMTSSDLDGTDILQGAAMLLMGGAIGALVASIPGRDENVKPEGPTESAKIEYGPYLFNASGENVSVHSQYSNRTYKIELENIMYSATSGHFTHTGNFNVTDMGTMEKTALSIDNMESAVLSENMSLYASIGIGGRIAELTVTEKYVKPLRE